MLKFRRDGFFPPLYTPRVETGGLHRGSGCDRSHGMPGNVQEPARYAQEHTDDSGKGEREPVGGSYREGVGMVITHISVAWLSRWGFQLNGSFGGGTYSTSNSNKMSL